MLNLLVLKFQMNAMILSAQYWPSFRDEKIDLPEEMKTALEKYTKAYEITKVNRTLKWEPHIGKSSFVVVVGAEENTCKWMFSLLHDMISMMHSVL